MTDQPLVQDAIAAALAQNWKEAIRINTQLLKTEKKDPETHLRLAFAFIKTAQLTAAKKTYEKILKLDPYNLIAQKHLKKLSVMKKKSINTHESTLLSPMIFLEEPGITKIVECIHVAPSQTLSSLSAGQEVNLIAKRHCVEIRTQTNTYLGALPDDVSFKLIKLLKAGNTYQAIIKGIENKCLKILIRELSRGKKFINQPSFISTTSYVPFNKGLAQGAEKPDMTPTGEDSEEEEKEPQQEE